MRMSGFFSMLRSSLRSIHTIRPSARRTDLGILSSHNGGGAGAEARDVIIGEVFALVFSPDGALVMCASAAVCSSRSGRLAARRAPESAIPARAWSQGQRTIVSI